MRRLRFQPLVYTEWQACRGARLVARCEAVELIVATSADRTEYFYYSDGCRSLTQVCHLGCVSAKN
jgi:hypothetical protein